MDAERILVQASDRMVAAVGVSDLIVVETDDALLIAGRGHGQRVREVVDEVRRRGGTEHSIHRTVRRPWGRYTVLRDSEPGYKVKRIEVRPGGRLSLQSHRHRSEHWVVVAGTATVTRGAAITRVAAGESTFIPAGERHRLENREAAPLIIVEVQVGHYVEEDDITRHEDDYGRDIHPPG